jgi:hypothetical protein
MLANLTLYGTSQRYYIGDWVEPTEKVIEKLELNVSLRSKWNGVSKKTEKDTLAHAI